MATIAAHDPNLVFVTYQTYSPTTSSHQSDVNRAISHLEKVYCYDPETYNDTRGNLRDYIIKIEDQYKILVAPKRRMNTRLAGLQAITRYLQQARDYYDAVPADTRNTGERSFIEAVALVLGGGNANDATTLQALQPFFEAENFELPADQFSRITEIYGDGVAAYMAAEAAKQEARRKFNDRINALIDSKSEQLLPVLRDRFEIELGVYDVLCNSPIIKKIYESVRRYKDNPYPKSDITPLTLSRIAEKRLLEKTGELLTLTTDHKQQTPQGFTVLTSKGARVDSRAALTLYHAWKAGKPIHGHEIDGFTVTEADADHIKIGCHTLFAPEINRMGSILEQTAVV